jgi:hypothetical protein
MLSDNFLEDAEQFLLGYASIAVLVDNAQKLLDVCIGDISLSVHAPKGVGDDALNLLKVKITAVIGIVLFKDVIDRVLKLRIVGYHTHSMLINTLSYNIRWEAIKFTSFDSQNSSSLEGYKVGQDFHSFSKASSCFSSIVSIGSFRRIGSISTTVSVRSCLRRHMHTSSS